MFYQYIIRIWLIRHGQTTWNEKGFCLGRTDIPLSSSGKQQVEAIANFPSLLQCDTVFSSPYIRAMETANLLVPYTTKQPIESDELREIDFGNWEGISWEEIIKNRQPEWNAWKKDPENSNPYNGESLLEAKERISNLYSRLLHIYSGQTILLVGHGGILNVLLCYLFHLPLKVIWTFKLSPASFSEVLISNSGPILSVLNYVPNIKSTTS